MDREPRKETREIKKFGNIEVEKTSDGRIVRINEILLQPGDKIITVQRHQKPGPFSKEQLFKSAPEGVEELSNLDYTYDPEITEAGTSAEDHLLNEYQKIFGPVDLIATTPRKRGSEHKKLLENQFSQAAESPVIDELLDDSGLGLMGESFNGAYKYSPEEARKLFNPIIDKEISFGRKSSQEKKEPFSYMEAWVKLGYINPRNKWKVESPEGLAERTEKLLGAVDKEKNYFITHEANCVVFHMLAQRNPAELGALLDQIEIPEIVRSKIKAKLENMNSIFELFKSVKNELTENPVREYNYKKVLISFLENIKLKSGGKGYGAISIYVLREGKQGEQILFEPAYDVQI